MVSDPDDAWPAPVPPPASGRVFEARRRVRLGDVSPAGRLRLDALVRYLQDVADDDARAAELPEAGWVVRRTEVLAHSLPGYQQPVGLRTWCGGLGSRWAERRTTLIDHDGVALAEAATIWVHVDRVSMRPLPLGPVFHDRYAEATGGRTVSARLGLGDPPADAVESARVWPLRFADFDALAHVNNAASWVAVEEVLTSRRDLRSPVHAIVEHRRAIERDDAVRLMVDHADDRVGIWLVRDDGAVAVAAAVRRC